MKFLKVFFLKVKVVKSSDLKVKVLQSTLVKVKVVKVKDDALLMLRQGIGKAKIPKCLQYVRRHYLGQGISC
jgi:hypothetical protein